jgi:peroxiredoxin
MELKALAPLVFLVACGGAPQTPVVAPGLTLTGTDGRSHALAPETAQAPATVYVFYNAHCPCVTAHVARLKALHDAYAPRGVQWFMVDSEVGASTERDAAFESEKTFGFPMLADVGGKLARATGAESATFSVVIDREGKVRYAGGIDDDRSHLRDEATPYLKDALEDVLAGRAVRRPEGKALGCALQLW